MCDKYKDTDSVKVSKKNRMYKVVILLVKYIFKCKNLVTEENNIKIEYSEIYDHNENCGVVKKRLWKHTKQL